MFKIAIAVLLVASNAAADQIVWRSPTAGVLTLASDLVVPPRSELEQPNLEIRYEPIHVTVGSSIHALPIGTADGYSFALKASLPLGLVLNPATGEVAGIAAVAGSFEIDVIVSAGMSSLTIPFSVLITA